MDSKWSSSTEIFALSLVNQREFFVVSGLCLRPFKNMILLAHSYAES